MISLNSLNTLMKLKPKRKVYEGILMGIKDSQQIYNSCEPIPTTYILRLPTWHYWNLLVLLSH
jgi:hypothetical protein